MHRRLREQQETDGDQGHAGKQGPAGAEAHDQRLRVAHRQRSHDQRRGKERQPDLKRVVAEHPLHVERPHEEQPEHPGDEQRLDQVGS